MISLGHPSLLPTDLGRLDDEEASPGDRSLQPLHTNYIHIIYKYASIAISTIFTRLSKEYPVDDLVGVFFHPELPVHVNKQTDLPAYLKQLALERIGDIPIDAFQVFTDGSRDDYYRSSNGIYIKSQEISS
ncbi:uncharacterized protein TNCV_1380101 [Trichonephila clavipes]|nr:uncharacterized protein TNCV_1380101 [Trichonephila clavipes]